MGLLDKVRLAPCWSCLGSPRAGSLWTLLSIVSLLGVTGCDAERKLPPSVGTELFRIGSLSGEWDAFGGVVGVALGVDGRIAVADARQSRVVLFDQDGALLGSFGRKGEGPGEFKSLAGVAQFDDGFLAIDAGNNRYGIYSLSGELLQEHRRTLFGISYPWVGEQLPDGRLLDSYPKFQESALTYVPVAVDFPSGEFQEFAEISSLPADPVLRVPPSIATHADRIVWRGDGSGGILFGASQGSAIYSRDLLSANGRVILNDLPRLPIPEANRVKIFEAADRTGLNYNRDWLPETYPTFKGIWLLSSGKVVLLAPLSEPGQSIFSIYSGDEMLGSFQLDLEWIPSAGSTVEGELLMGVAHDEIGIQYVVAISFAS